MQNAKDSMFTLVEASQLSLDDKFIKQLRIKKQEVQNYAEELYDVVYCFWTELSGF